MGGVSSGKKRSGSWCASLPFLLASLLPVVVPALTTPATAYSQGSQDARDGFPEGESRDEQRSRDASSERESPAGEDTENEQGGPDATAGQDTPAGQDTAEPKGYQPYNPFIESEDPATVFSLDRTDAEVDLYLLGSWIARSRFSTGIAFHPPLPEDGSTTTYPYEFPGFETELFDQTLDLVLSLWLYDRYFFEAGFSDESDVNTFATGYVAVEDELVQELVFGNVPLTIDRYPYQYTGSPNARAGNAPNPGAVVRLQTARTYHELLLQLENSRLETRRFTGGGVLRETRLQPEEYLRAGVYVLPHAPIDDLAVYVHDPDGSVEIETDHGVSRMFRRLSEDAGDYVAEKTTGLIRLDRSIPQDIPVAAAYTPADPDGRVLALDEEQTPLAQTVGFPFTGDAQIADFEAVYGSGSIDRYRVEVTSGASSASRGVMLYDPGRYSPFAAANHYELPADASSAIDDGSARLSLVRRGTRRAAEEEEQLLLEPVAEGTLLQVLRRSGGSPDGARPEPWERDWKHPFAGVSPTGEHAAMYGPRSHPLNALASFDILLEYRSVEEGLFLDGDVVPGTAVVTRNGRPIPGATVDYATGEVTLPEGQDTDATVDVRYRVYTPEEGIGDLVVISGNRWQVNESLLLSTAVGMRWSIGEETFSREMEEHPGQITGSASAEYSGDSLSVDAAAAVQVFHPDTTGFFRLFGGEAETFRITPDATTLFPASTPTHPTHPDQHPDYLADKRAPALYRDYWTSRGSDAVLQDYTVDVPADENREGARMGPYLANSTDSANSGAIGVLEWEGLAPEEWTGALIRVSSPPQDLRDARSITVTYRYIPENSGYDGTGTKLEFQIGALEEDLDGDGRASRGRSAVDPTFEFTFPSGHPRAGEVRRVGQDAPGLGAPHREDPRRDGILRREIPERVLTVLTDDIGTDGAWRSHTITLSPEDAERLAEVRAARVLVRNNTDADGSTDTVPGGKLLLGDIKVHRSGNATVTRGQSRNAAAGIGSDPGRREAAYPPLRDTAAVVADRFNPDEKDQPVLELTWDNGSGGADSQTVAVEFSIPDFSTNRYGRLVFYTFLTPPEDTTSSSAPAETVTLSLLPYRNAAESAALTVELPGELLFDGDGWKEISVDLETGTVEIDGASAAGATATIPKNSTMVLRLATITVEGITNAGRLYFDELHATDPQLGIAAAGRVGVTWQTDLGGGQLALEQDLAARMEGFRGSDPESTVTDAPGMISGRSRASFRQNRFLLAGEASYRFEDTGPEDIAVGALGHTIAIPIGPADPLNLIVEEDFFQDFDARSPLAERRIGTSLGTTGIGRYRFSHLHRTDARETLLRWDAAAQPPSAGPVTLGVDAEADLRDLDRPIASKDYGEAWLDTGQYFFPPGPSGKNSRQERGLTGRSRLGVFMWNTSVTGGWRNRSATAGNQQNTVTVDTELPLKFEPPAARAWGLTPAYTRSWRRTDREESVRFSDDFDIWRTAVSEEPVAFTAIPFLELFRSPEDTGLDALSTPTIARRYTPEARMTYSRAPGSRVSDLFLPAEAEALIRRTTTWEADSRTDERTWRTSLTAVAINLFGEQGSTPIAASWYKSDEFRNRLALELTETVPDGVSLWTIDARNEALFLGFSDNELALQNGIEFAGNGVRKTTLSSAITYTWRVDGYPRLEVFERMETAPFYRHTERVQVDASFEEEEFQGAEVGLGHESALVVGKNGEFRVFADLGWIADPAEYEEGALHILGFQAGVEGVLRY